MSSSKKSDKMMGMMGGMSKEMMVEHGRAIAHAMDEHKIQQKKNMAKAERRQSTMLKHAADVEIGRNY